MEGESPLRLRPKRQSHYLSQVKESDDRPFNVNIMSAENASSCDVGESGDENNKSLILGANDDEGKYMSC